MHVYLGNRLGVEQYGYFSFALSIATLVAALAPMGWVTASLRFASAYAAAADWSLFKGLMIRSHQFVAAFSLGAMALLLALTFLVENPWKSDSVELAAWMVPVLAIISLHKRIFRALSLGATSIVIDRLVLAMVFLVLATMLGWTEFSQIGVGYLVSLVVVLTLSSCLLMPRIWTNARDCSASYSTREWMITAFPMLLGTVGQLALNKTDILMLGALNSGIETGYYAASNRITIIIVFALGAISTLGAPMLSSAYYQRRFDDLKELFWTITLWSTAFSIPVFILVVIFSEQLLGLFGSGFQDSTKVLLILSLGKLIHAITGPVGHLLLMTGNERVYAVTIGASSVLNVVGNAIVIPRYGAVGAACVTAASIVVMNIAQLVFAMRSLKRLDHDGSTEQNQSHVLRSD